MLWELPLHLLLLIITFFKLLIWFIKGINSSFQFVIWLFKPIKEVENKTDTQRELKIEKTEIRELWKNFLKLKDKQKVLEDQIKKKGKRKKNNNN
jgi:hypothetical protein